MKLKFILISFILGILFLVSAFQSDNKDAYLYYYISQYDGFSQEFESLIIDVKSSKPDSATIKLKLHNLRLKMKVMDFWWRYLDPISYRSINSPLSVEWETEVFEKFEKPYKREGAGLTLAELAFDENENNWEANLFPIKDALLHLKPDSLYTKLSDPGHFLFCNRLFLLNLTTIYNTGFECPDTSRIIPEIQFMCLEVDKMYQMFLSSKPEFGPDDNYLKLYKSMLQFLNKQSNHYSAFNHYTFIRDYINPLFELNAELIRQKSLRSKNLVDYSLNKNAKSIFDKTLYMGQNTKGVFSRIEDSISLNYIKEFGKLMFFDPILSVNNERSCASCHKPDQFFTDNKVRSAESLDHKGRLTRNTATLVNAEFNHLIMADGKHISLHDQASAVMSHPDEMGIKLEDILEKVLSCKDYSIQLKKLAAMTPAEPKPSLAHISSAIIYYYTSFSNYYSPFDRAMLKKENLNKDVIAGFNLFMSKAQCATCHFIPQFNGVKPPYIGSEFEVLGVPEDTFFLSIGKDSGRYHFHQAPETIFAFRTSSLRNISKTAPYMHNGIYFSLEEVMKFYNDGGGAGRGLQVSNQTLSSDKLGLTQIEIKQIIAFMNVLNEDVMQDTAPSSLPLSKNKELNIRKPGGIY